MKTIALRPAEDAAPILQLTDVPPPAEPAAAQARPGASGQAELARARAFAEPLLATQLLDTGEGVLAHADGVAAILESIGAAPAMRAAVYLVYAGDFLQRPDEVVRKAFGDSYASLVEYTRKLVQIQRAARDATVELDRREQQNERVRKMLLAFSRDLRVVLLRLASRLQTLRWHAAARRPCPAELALESQQVFAPLANRLGIWQIKWEIEDLSFRFLQPQDYLRIARQLDETRAQREHAVEAARRRLLTVLRSAGVVAEVQGRPKHLYSIWKKMQGKGLSLDHMFDLRALRVIVADVRDCYAALSCVHCALSRAARSRTTTTSRGPRPMATSRCTPWCATTTVVRCEVQIRTRAMHDHAEHGVAAHWAYKEAGAKGYGGVQATGALRRRVAAARKAVLRQLLAWERDLAALTTGDGARRVRRPHLRVHAAGHRDRAAARRHAGRLRLQPAHRPGPPLPRRRASTARWCR